MLFQNSPLKRQGWHQGMQKDGRCWLNHQLHGGLKRLRPAILQWQHLEMIQVAIHYSKMAHWKARAGIKECKRMADAGSITNFIVGWKVEASLLCGGSWAALEPKWRNAKKWFAHLPWACLHMAQGRAPFQRLCPPPEASLIKWSMAVDKNNLDHGCTAKTWTNLDRFHLQP